MKKVRTQWQNSLTAPLMRGSFTMLLGKHHSWRFWLLSGVGFLLVMVAIATIFFLFAPFSIEEELCQICGRNKSFQTVLGIRWRESERASDTSQWYVESGLPKHKHEWTPLCQAVREEWGGVVENYDSFGWQILHLHSFKEASQNMDQATFQEFAEEYFLIGNDNERIRLFCVRLAPFLESTPSSENEEP